MKNDNDKYENFKKIGWNTILQNNEIVRTYFGGKQLKSLHFLITGFIYSLFLILLV